MSQSFSGVQQDLLPAIKPEPNSKLLRLSADTSCSSDEINSDRTNASTDHSWEDTTRSSSATVPTPIDGKGDFSLDLHQLVKEEDGDVARESGPKNNLGLIPQELLDEDKHPNFVPFREWLQTTDSRKLDNVVGVKPDIHPEEPVIFPCGYIDAAGSQAHILQTLESSTHASCKAGDRYEQTDTAGHERINFDTDTVKSVNAGLLESFRNPQATKIYAANIEIDKVSNLGLREPPELLRRRPMRWTSTPVLSNVTPKGVAVDVHIDAFNGPAYPIGLKLWLFWPPTLANSAAYFDFAHRSDRVRLLLGKLTGCQYYITLPGNALYIPEGWIHTTYALESGMVVFRSFCTDIGVNIAAQWTASEFRDGKFTTQEDLGVLAQSLALNVGIGPNDKAPKAGTKRTQRFQLSRANKTRKTNLERLVEVENGCPTITSGSMTPEAKSRIYRALDDICPQKLKGKCLADLEAGTNSNAKAVRALLGRVKGCLMEEEYGTMTCKRCKKKILTHFPG